jgi:hypothetical protein
MNIIAKVKINNRGFDLDHYNNKHYKVQECNDKNYWEILDDVPLGCNKYIRKSRTVIIKEYSPEDYPELYL